MTIREKNPQIKIGDTQAQKKLIAFLKKRDANLTEKELSLFVWHQKICVVVQKIYTEPQAQIKYEEIIDNGVKTKRKIIETDIKELGKVIRGKAMPLTTALRNLVKRLRVSNKNVWKTKRLDATGLLHISENRQRTT